MAIENNQPQEKINWGEASLGSTTFSNAPIEVGQENIKDDTTEEASDEVKDETTTETGQEGEVKEEETKEEVDADEPEPVINQFLKKLPFDFKDETGKPIEFENNVDGILQAAELSAEKFIEQRDEAFFAEYPEARDLFIHLQNGGTVDTFVKHSLPDFSKIQIDSTNTAQQKNIYTQYLKMKGLSASEIEDLVSVSVSGNTLLTKANNALGELNKYREHRLVSERKQVEEKSRIAEQEAQETLKEVNTVLSAGKLLGAEIDKQSQDSLFKALTVRDKKTGLTVLQQKEANLTLEQELFIKNLILNDFKGVIPKTVKKLEELKDLQIRDREATIKGKETKEDSSKKGFDFGKVRTGANGSLTMLN